MTSHYCQRTSILINDGSIFAQKKIFRHRLYQIEAFFVENHVVNFYLFLRTFELVARQNNFRKTVSQQLFTLTDFDL